MKIGYSIIELLKIIFIKYLKPIFDWLDDHACAITVIPTIAIVCLTSQYVTYSGKQWVTMENQLRQMESQTRPWVGLDAENHPLRTSPIIIDINGAARTDCIINVKNFGNYPAQNAVSLCDIIITQTTDPVVAKEKELCTSSGPSFGGAVIFPSGKQSWGWTVFVSKNQMVPNPDSIASGFQAYAVGCIQYRDQFGGPNYTAFAYRLQAPGSIAGLVFKVTPGTNIPQGEWVAWDGFVDQAHHSPFP